METRQRQSFTDDYKRQAVDLVASSGRSIGSVEGTRPARFRFAPFGGTTWGRAGADGGVAAPHNAGGAAVEMITSLSHVSQKIEVSAVLFTCGDARRNLSRSIAETLLH